MRQLSTALYLLVLAMLILVSSTTTAMTAPAMEVSTPPTSMVR